MGSWSDADIKCHGGTRLALRGPIRLCCARHRRKPSFLACSRLTPQWAAAILLSNLKCIQDASGCIDNAQQLHRWTGKWSWYKAGSGTRDMTITYLQTWPISSTCSSDTLCSIFSTACILLAAVSLLSFFCWRRFFAVSGSSLSPSSSEASLLSS